jgi:hypothetical protein
MSETRKIAAILVEYSRLACVLIMLLSLALAALWLRHWQRRHRLWA